MVVYSVTEEVGTQTDSQTIQNGRVPDWQVNHPFSVQAYCQATIESVSDLAPSQLTLDNDIHHYYIEYHELSDTWPIDIAFVYQMTYHI